jgi:hypothetical protein
MLLAAQNDTRASRPIWVDVPAQIGCPDEGALLTALRARFGRERVRVGRALAQDLSLRLVTRGPRALTMVLREGGSTIVERGVEVAEGECAALAHTLALIAESWLAAPLPRPRAKNRVAAPEQQRSVPASPEETATASTPTTVLTEEAAPTSVPAPAAEVPPSATPAGATYTPMSEPAVPAIPAPPVAAVPAADSGKVASSRSHETPKTKVQHNFPAGLQDRPWSITLAASGGAVFPLEGPTAWAAVGVLDLQLGYRRWFGGVRSVLESPTDLHPAVGNAVAGASDVTALPSTGTMAVRYTPVGAYAGRVLVESNRFTFAALAGGGMDILSARASGYSSDSSYTAIDAMAFAGLRGEWRFSGRFGAVATSDVAFDFRRYQFSVVNVGPVARTTRARSGFALGVAWHL